MKSSVQINLNVLVTNDDYEDGAWWVAQCVEYDIVSQSRTSKGAVDEFIRTLKARLVLAAKREQTDPFETLRPASEEVRAKFERGQSEALYLEVPKQIDIPGVHNPVGLRAQLAS